MKNFARYLLAVHFVEADEASFVLIFSNPRCSLQEGAKFDVIRWLKDLSEILGQSFGKSFGNPRAIDLTIHGSLILGSSDTLASMAGIRCGESFEAF